MHSTTTLLITLLPLLSVIEAKSYRGKGGSSSNSQNALLGTSMLQSTSGSSPQQFGDTNPGTQCYNGGNTGNAGNAAGCNDCGLSTFTELTLNQNPLVSDCQQMIANIQADQEWNVTFEKRTLTHYGTCAFNAVAPNGGAANIGNADIIDLVTDSIKQFQRGEYVGCQGGYSQTVSSSGTMPCDNAAVEGATQVRIDWTLTTSGTVSGGGSGGGSGTFWPGTGGQGGVSQGGNNNNNNNNNDWDWINTNQGQGQKQNTATDFNSWGTTSQDQKQNTATDFNSWGTTNQGQNQKTDPNNWNINLNQKQDGSSSQDQTFDVNNLQTTNNNGNPPQIQRRDGKIYKVVKW